MSDTGATAPPLASTGTPAAAIFVMGQLAPVGGAEECIVTTALALRERGVAVAVLVRWPTSRRNPYVRRLRAAGIAVESAPMPAPLSRLLARLRPQLAGRYTRRWVERRVAAGIAGGGPGTVVHVHGSHLSCAWAVAFAAARGAPVVFMEHAGFETLAAANDPNLAQVARANVLLCHSRAAAEAFHAVLPVRANVAVFRSIIAGPTRWEPPAGGRAAFPVQAVCVGRLTPGKGIEILLRAMARVVEVEPRVHLTIAGDGPQRRELERLRASLRLDGAVTFIGGFPHERLASVLEGAAILVHPSLSEGLPLAVLEAMAYGKAIVATAVGGVPDVITDGEHGLLIPAGDEQALAAALLRAISDTALRERLGGAARSAFVDGGHSPGAVAESLIARYAEAIAGAGTPPPSADSRGGGWSGRR